MDYMMLKNFPKIDLHCHLDGSMSPEVVAEIAQQQGIAIPQSKSELKQLLTVEPNCKSLKEYLTRFDLPIDCLQTPYGLQAAAYQLLRDAAAENVMYIEVRFAPIFSVNEQMDLDTVIKSVLKGMRRAREDFAVHSSLILCAMRHLAPQQGMQLVDVAKQYKNSGVGGIDLAGNEADFPLAAFAELFCYAKQQGVNFTIHAGETGSYKNIETAVKFGAKRVGHGIAVFNDADTVKLCKNYGMVFELCPTSNYQTRAVAADVRYPIDEYMQQGLLFTVNTDNRTVSDTTITREFELLQSHTDVTKEFVKNVTLTAIDAAFTDEKTKEKLRERIVQV